MFTERGPCTLRFPRRPRAPLRRLARLHEVPEDAALGHGPGVQESRVAQELPDEREQAHLAVGTFDARLLRKYTSSAASEKRHRNRKWIEL